MDEMNSQLLLDKVDQVCVLVVVLMVSEVVGQIIKKLVEDFLEYSLELDKFWQQIAIGL